MRVAVGKIKGGTEAGRERIPAQVQLGSRQAGKLHPLLQLGSTAVATHITAAIIINIAGIS